MRIGHSKSEFHTLLAVTTMMMRGLNTLLISIGGFLAVVSPFAWAAPLHTGKPLKVFVLAGQSNIAGWGYIDKTNETDGSYLKGTLEYLVETDPETYGKLKNDEGDWEKRDDVLISYNRQSVYAIDNEHGSLVVGFGGCEEVVDLGPELSFGWTVGDALKEDGDNDNLDEIRILLIKIAWGGQNLAVDFRPPSSGGDTGSVYRGMMNNLRETLEMLETFVPGYTFDRGYELAGFAWHQGWSDSKNSTMVDEYETNLANLIRDIRKDLGFPRLPVSIGVTGMGGWEEDDHKRTRIANAQLAVADATKYPEFEGNVATVETRDFFREVSESPGDEKWHWNNNAESYWLVGEAMAEAMLELVELRENSEHYRWSTWLRHANRQLQYFLRNIRVSDKNLRGRNR